MKKQRTAVIGETAIAGEFRDILRDKNLQKVDTTVPNEACGRAELMRRKAAAAVATATEQPATT